VCPVACIPVDPDHVESRDSLWRKYQRLSGKSEDGAPAAPADGASAPS
jgi:hypothetical protein